MRKGYIQISDEIYSKQYDLVFGIFEHFRPTHIEHRHWENVGWFLFGISDKFDSLNEGDLTPRYDVTITKLNNGKCSYSFNRVN